MGDCGGGSREEGWMGVRGATTSSHFMSAFHEDGDEDIPCSSPIFN